VTSVVLHYEGLLGCLLIAYAYERGSAGAAGAKIFFPPIAKNEKIYVFIYTNMQSIIRRDRQYKIKN